MYNIQEIRRDFPILSRTVHNRPLVYLDNAATTQKPLAVLDAMREEYLNVNANVHRGIHWMSQQATELHEAARETVSRFINAGSTSEIIFTRGTTESLNLLAATYTQQFMQPGDEVIISTLEHHSNIVPWQLQARQKGIRLRVIPIGDDGTLMLHEYEKLFSPRTKLVSIAHVSNVMGTINPIRQIIDTAHSHGVPVAIDGAQSVPHFKVDVQQLDCDFFAFSGHKLYGPTGIGILYGKAEWLDKLPPYQGGGEMIEHVSFEHTTFERPPLKFEAGTPDYIATHGLATAIHYLETLGMDNIRAHERRLTQYALRRLSEIPRIRLFPPLAATSSGPEAATAPAQDAVISFLVADIHPSDLGTILDRLGLALRTGHHCAQPLMQRLGIPGTVRASLGLYNTEAEVDSLVSGLATAISMF